MITTDPTTPPASRIGATARTLGASAGVVWLHHLGSRPWAHTPRVTSIAEALDVLASAPADTVVAVLRLVALGVGLWVTGATAVDGATAVVRWWSLRPRAARRPLTPARQAVEALTVGTVTSGLLTWSAVATASSPGRPADLTSPVATVAPRGTVPAPPGVVPPTGSRPRAGGTRTSAVPPTRPIGVRRPDPSDTTSPGLPAPTPPGRPDPPRHIPGLHPPEATDAPRRHVVRRGESLWTIAEGRGGQSTVGGRGPAAQRSVVHRWRRLVALNRDRLRSGDPDRILPGERLRLP